MNDTQQIPIGVKTISGLLLVVAFLFIVLSIVLLKFTFNPMWIIWTFGLGFIFFIFLALLCISMAIFLFLVARGLWKIKNWARKTTIVLAIIFFLGSFRALLILYSSNSGNVFPESVIFLLSVLMIVCIVLGAIVALCLMFSKRVKETFN